MVKQYKMQQNLLHSFTYFTQDTLSHLSRNPATERQSQNLCMFLGLHQKGSMPPHNLSFLSITPVQKVYRAVADLWDAERSPPNAAEHTLCLS